MSSALWLAMLVALPAHQVGISHGTWTLDGGTVDAQLVFAASETSLGEVAEGVQVAVEGSPCDPTLREQHPADNDGHAVHLRFSCTKAGVLGIDLSGMFAVLGPGHRHLAHITAQGPGGTTAQDAVAFAGAPLLNLGVATPVAAYLRIGVEHILGGFDHLVFLFGLILVARTLRSLLTVITAFTLAHSISLGLAVLGVVAPSPSLVEPLIALSIAWVGIENLFLKDPSRRWRITAPFGLIHGFGFAGALAEVGVPRGQAPMVLLLFNLGVELGQLLVLALVLPVLVVLRKRGWLGVRGTRALSVLVIVAGLFWLVERVLAVITSASVAP